MKMPVDVFVTYRDDETWQGEIHATQALKQDPDVIGILAKSIVVATTSVSRQDAADATRRGEPSSGR